MKKSLLTLCMIAAISCSKKPSLSSEDVEYVRTSVDLMRIRASMAPGTDSATVKYKVDSVCHVHHTTRGGYLTYTKEIGSDPKRADMIYNAINDSTGGNK